MVNKLYTNKEYIKSNRHRYKQWYDLVLQVKATHAYAGEDVDELTFDTGDIIRVIPFEDPEDMVYITHIFI